MEATTGSQRTEDIRREEKCFQWSDFLIVCVCVVLIVANTHIHRHTPTHRHTLRTVNQITVHDTPLYKDGGLHFKSRVHCNRITL